MKHALVIGGTGMLKDTSVWLNRHGYHLSVIARNKKGLLVVEEALDIKEAYSSLSLDYSNDDILRTGIQDLQKRYGPIQLVISWISSPAPNALRIVINEVDQINSREWYLYHVLGSRSKLDEVKKRVSPPSKCIYRQVQLGFIIEKNNSRWLTHREISSGVVEAITSGASTTIVGSLEPWEMRP